MTHLWIIFSNSRSALKFLLKEWRERGLSVLYLTVQEKDLLSRSFLQCSLVSIKFIQIQDWGTKGSHGVKQKTHCGVKLQVPPGCSVASRYSFWWRISIPIYWAQATDKPFQISSHFISPWKPDIFTSHVSILSLAQQWLSQENIYHLSVSSVCQTLKQNPVLFPSLHACIHDVKFLINGCIE